MVIIKKYFYTTNRSLDRSLDYKRLRSEVGVGIGVSK